MAIISSRNYSRLRLGNQLGREGHEGKVFDIGKSNLAAKIYFDSKRTSERQHKIEALIAASGRISKSSSQKVSHAWPVDIVKIDGTFAGFLMPKAPADSETLIKLTQRIPRKGWSQQWNGFDRRDYWHTIRRLKLAVNLSVAVHAIHQVGDCVIGDFKPDNILATPDGSIFMIDLDSVQYRDSSGNLFPAGAATPEYIPPELYNGSPAAVLEPAWDRFALAVLIYKILLGVHPYSGGPTGPYERCGTLAEKIGEGLFLFGSKNSFIKDKLGYHKQYPLLPRPVRHLFLRAFDLGHRQPDKRPSAEEWGKALFAVIKAAEAQQGLAPSPIKKQSSPKTPTVYRPSTPPTLPIVGLPPSKRTPVHRIGGAAIVSLTASLLFALAFLICGSFFAIGSEAGTVGAMVGLAVGAILGWKGKQWRIHPAAEKGCGIVVIVVAALICIILGLSIRAALLTE